jgi:hypothetical protein
MLHIDSVSKRYGAITALNGVSLDDTLAAAIAAAFGGDKDEIRDAIANGDFGLSRLTPALKTSRSSERT